MAKKKTTSGKSKKAAVPLRCKKGAAAAASKTKGAPRKEFLTKLGELAAAPGVSAAQAADRLGLTAAAFEALLAGDAKAGRTWRHAKTDALVRAGDILWKLADDGNTAAARQILESLQSALAGAGDLEAMSVKAVADLIGESKNKIDYWYRKHGMPKNLDGTVSLTAFLRWYQRWLVAEHTFDPHRVKMVDLEPFLGVSRQAINDWLKEGLPRNADRTFSLAAVFGWRIAQLGARPESRQAPSNPLADIKAERLAVEIDKAKKNLLPRGPVELGLVARTGVLVQYIDRKGRELKSVLGDKAIEPLDAFFDGLKQAAAEVPEEIADALPPDRADAVKAALGILTAETAVEK